MVSNRGSPTTRGCWEAAFGEKPFWKMTIKKSYFFLAWENLYFWWKWPFFNFPVTKLQSNIRNQHIRNRLEILMPLNRVSFYQLNLCQDWWTGNGEYWFLSGVSKSLPTAILRRIPGEAQRPTFRRPLGRQFGGVGAEPPPTTLLLILVWF